MDHDLLQRFPADVWHCGSTGRQSHREQQQQLLVVRPPQQAPQGGAAVERSGGQRDEAGPLDGGQQEAGGDAAGDLVVVVNSSLPVLHQSEGLLELQYQVGRRGQIGLHPVSSDKLQICCPLNTNGQLSHLPQYHYLLPHPL